MIFGLSPVFADGDLVKVNSLKYDNSSSMVLITTSSESQTVSRNTPLKVVRLTNPNRIYFDIENAVLLGSKQHLDVENSIIKEIRLAQFSTEPNVVRAVITFEEDYDTSKLKTYTLGNAVIVKLFSPEITNDYFNTVYEEGAKSGYYAGITVNSQAVQRVPVRPVEENSTSSSSVINDIKNAFENSTLSNTDGKTYDSVVSVDLSSNLKLRTKYFINRYMPKNGGLLISGVGQVTTAKEFFLTSPDRAVIDLPNTYLEKSIRNKEINLCSDGSCTDTAKIGQFDYNTARIVVNSDKPDKYMCIYSQDAQSLFIIDSSKLKHTSFSPIVSNINKAYVKKVDSKTNELILSFTAPVVYSLLRTDNSFTLFLFNVQSYNEQDLIKTLSSSYYKKLTLALLPQIGVKAGMFGISKEDIVKVEQSADSRALKLTITKVKQDEPKISGDRHFRKKTKDKIVLDAGHGGSDYGAIREGINEKDLTLDITKRVEAILRSKGYKTALTRSDDTFVSLEDRVAFSEKEEPEIFISIHINSAVSTDPNGIETHWYHDYSKRLAETVHNHLVKELPNAKDRGLFKSKFYVINHTTDPAILCEVGFLSNESERNEMLTDLRKQKTAKAIADGIIEYLKNMNKGEKQ